ncbi:MAG: aconitate hydratase AcnA [Gemmatales bacterium]|nr:aconitate hydratase AcnA [Gemmatales bacterium]MDW7994605.1 aconitate hydratase AcnA [Gemmatales bacterium]
MADSFHARRRLRVQNREYEYYSLSAVARIYPEVNSLPFSLKILLENLLRQEDGVTVRPEDIAALAQWNAQAEPEREIAFTPARVLLQDFTGVPALVDLAAMREAIQRFGGDPRRVNPLQPAELVIDHSVQVDAFGQPEAWQINSELEYQRNRERYVFLRWGQQAFDNFRVVPPQTGIVHQVNLEYLARVVFVRERAGVWEAYPDTLVGTDSHTTMVNGLGVLGWGVGGIEAEAALLGQPISMLVPQVVGFRLTGRLRAGATATDLVLTITQILRRHGVVGKFVEFFGDGVAALPVADRATIANMAPEYGATCGFFPIDGETLRYLRLTGRPETLIALVEAYAKEQGLFYTPDQHPARYSAVLELDLSTVESSVAGPSRPQDRVPLSQAAASFRQALPTLLSAAKKKPSGQTNPNAGNGQLSHGAVVIAAITSCTNTSNPSVMIAAGLLAKKAVERGLRVPAWVKTSLAPGSKVVTEYLRASGLLAYLEQLRFHLVGYGCTTCIGNSGPLPEEVAQEIESKGLVAVAVLSGNRNFEGRIHPLVRANYLMSPPLVVAYALAGRLDIDLTQEPLGQDPHGQPVYLRDIWPEPEEIQAVLEHYHRRELYEQQYRHVFEGDERWQALPAPQGELFAWDEQSTYVRRPPYFDGLPLTPPPVEDLRGLRVLCFLGDSITTDHISPAGSIAVDSPAGRYLIARGVPPQEFNSYGARRGNHEVMVRGTFANVRLKNRLVPGQEGGWTRYFPEGTVMTIFEAAEKYQAAGVPLLVIAGKEYGSGSSRDWAAKGPRLLGVRVVLAESFERIHRSNLVGMGILPLQFLPNQNADSLGLTGNEIYDILGLPQALQEPFSPGRTCTIAARHPDGRQTQFHAVVRIDTPREAQYYQHGGILPYVLRQLLQAS